MSQSLTIVALFGTLLALAAGCSAQSSVPAGSFTIAGKVTNSVTGEPVQKALVIIIGFESLASRNSSGDVSPGGVNTDQILTDAAGAFRFSSLSAGSYQITTQKPQFEQDRPAAQASEPIVLGPSRDGLELRLSPEATIDGTVVDADGLPLQGVNIQLLENAIVDGDRESRQARSVATDDRGRYRLWDLHPGKYYLRAAGRSGGTRLYLGERAPTFDSHECFAPMYYGGAQSLSSTTPMVLKAGQHQHGDFTLALQPAFRIHGSIANFIPYQTVRFELLSGTEDVSANRVALNTSQGRFEIQDVIPGPYRLRATQGTGKEQTRAETILLMPSADVHDVGLQLQPGVDLTGTVHCAAPAIPTMRFQCFAQVLLRGSSRSERYRSAATDNTPFTLRGVLPGEYTVEITALGQYVSSVTAGGIDLLPTRKLIVTPGASLGPLEIWVKQDGGAIEGTLEIQDRPAGARVLLIPDFPTVTAPVAVVAGEGGKFHFTGLAPGSYALYAFAKLDEIEYRNPEVMRGYRAGARARVEVNGHEQVKLTEIIQ